MNGNHTLYFSDRQYDDNTEYDVNGNNESNEDDTLGLASLFADLPSNLPSRSYHTSKSRKSLRRRASAKRPSNVSAIDGFGSYADGDIESLTDFEDGVDSSEIRNLPEPMAKKKSVR